MLAIHVGLVLLFRYDIFKIQLCNFETVLQFTKPKCEEYSLKKKMETCIKRGSFLPQHRVWLLSCVLDLYGLVSTWGSTKNKVLCGYKYVESVF